MNTTPEAPMNKATLRRLGIAAGVLVGIDLVARLVARWALPAGTDALQVGAWAILAMVVAAGVTGFRWTRERRVPAVAGDLFWVVLGTTLVVTLVGPLVSAHPSYALGLTLAGLGLCAALLTVGAGGGVLLAVALGLDPTSRAWRAQAAKVKRRAAPAKAKRQPGARR
jgi:hypothetical protein